MPEMNFFQPAALEPWMMGMMIPIIGLMIPIIAILISHQQKMAQIIHGDPKTRGNAAIGSEIAQLRQDVAELRELIHQQTIQMDSLLTRNPPSTSEVRANLTAGQG